MVRVNKQKIETILAILNILLSVFAIAFIINSLTPTVSATDAIDDEYTTLNCCEQTNEGAICQEIVEAETDEKCNSSKTIFPGTCDEFTDCQYGCCFDPDEGTCSENSPKAKCENDGGDWYDDTACNINECEYGCCVVGSEAFFTTETRCELMLDFYGLTPTDDIGFFNSIISEFECIAQANNIDQGACVYGSDEPYYCLVNTESECYQLNGNWWEGKLCTVEEFNTNCERTQETTCVEGKDEVYFVDSCGNPANVYDSSKINNEDYWTEIVSKEESCGYGSDNAGSSSCGNCERYLGSVCGEGSADYGDYSCQELDCENAPANGGGTQDRKNGESWCVYESYIGDGKDAVGSRHYRYSCEDGEIIVDACQDFRNGVCEQAATELDGGTEYTVASCRANLAALCIQTNIEYGEAQEDGEEYDLEEECLANPDCKIQNVNVDSDFKFDLCVPKYPLGFDIKSESSMEVNSNLCSLATQTCTIVYKKDHDGDWECKKNCDCRGEKFTQQMNDLCISLGDCGAYVNVYGDITDEGYSVSGHKATELSDDFLQDYEDYADAVEGQVVEDTDMNQYLAEIGIPEGVGTAQEDQQLTELSGQILETIGASSSIVFVTAWLTGSLATASIVGEGGAGFVATVMGAMNAGAGGTALSIVFGAFAYALAGAAIGAAIGYYLGVALGMENEGLIAFVVGGAIIGAVVTLMVTGLINVWNPVGWVLLIIAVVAMLWSAITGWGKTKTKEVTFTCTTWQPPDGGERCHECNDDELGCTRYKCQSLGKGCELLNQGTEEEICNWINAEDISVPVISPWTEYISEDMEYTEITDDGFKLRTEDGNCISEFTPLVYGINTDEAAQCKITQSAGTSYEDIEEYFGGKSYYMYNHTNTYYSVSVASLIYEVEPDEPYYLFGEEGEIDFYVKCKDYNGNYNVKDYVINVCVEPGPDLTPPKITQTDPEDGGYIKYNATEQDVKIWINEPAVCKWAESDVDYDTMPNDMTCLTGLTESDLYGWPCETTIDLDDSDAETFYFRCKDQPWYAETNESARNVNTESTPLELIRSASALEISDVSTYPGTEEGIISVSQEPATIQLNVKTQGGAENGKAECTYKFSNFNNYVQFYDTFDDEHNQEFNSITEDKYEIEIRCEDVAGNSDYEKIEFEVEVDESKPLVSRVYNSAGSLKVITSEKAECVYSTDNSLGCNYEFEDGTSMETGLSISHNAPWDPENVYFIKCQDSWENKPDKCSIVVSPYDM